MQVSISRSNNIRVSNILDPDQARHLVKIKIVHKSKNVGPALCPNCLQKFTADDTKYGRLLKLNSMLT